MKKVILIMLLPCFGYINAQQDTSFTLFRFGTPAIFSYKKFSQADQYKNVKGAIDFPQYSFNESQFKRIKGLLDLFVTNENEFTKLRRNLNEKDSIYLAKIAVYNQMDSIQNLRAKNFEQAYNSLVLVNTQFNQQLINCKDIAEKEVRKNKFNSAMFGVLAGLTTGVILGVTLSGATK
jgi:hypothetical protein